MVFNYQELWDKEKEVETLEKSIQFTHKLMNMGGNGGSERLREDLDRKSVLSQELEILNKKKEVFERCMNSEEQIMQFEKENGRKPRKEKEVTLSQLLNGK